MCVMDSLYNMNYNNDPDMSSHHVPDQVVPANQQDKIFEEILRSTLGIENESVEGMWDINKVLKGSQSPSLGPIKEEIKMARKPRMRTVEQYLCDKCDKVVPITESPQPPAGFVVHGNIYDANPARVGGLIGNNFPLDPGEEGTMEMNQVKQTVMCKQCFMESLMLAPSQVTRRSSSATDDAMRSGIRVSDR
jgi:hypothetical protein